MQFSLQKRQYRLLDACPVGYFCVNIGKSDYLAGRAASQIRFGYTVKIILDLKFLFYLMSYMAKVDIELVKVILQRASLTRAK
ncbi:MAG: hypothetical protein ACLUKN_10735 [Bacilli bacterium]